MNYYLFQKSNKRFLRSTKATAPWELTGLLGFQKHAWYLLCWGCALLLVSHLHAETFNIKPGVALETGGDVLKLKIGTNVLRDGWVVSRYDKLKIKDPVFELKGKSLFRKGELVNEDGQLVSKYNMEYRNLDGSNLLSRVDFTLLHPDVKLIKSAVPAFVVYCEKLNTNMTVEIVSSQGDKEVYRPSTQEVDSKYNVNQRSIKINDSTYSITFEPGKNSMLMINDNRLLDNSVGVIAIYLKYNGSLPEPKIGQPAFFEGKIKIHKK